MGRRFSDRELSELRNVLPIRFVIENVLEIPGKDVEGVFRFVCPCCYESQTAINSKTNLSRCFLCKRNFNTIEIFMSDKRVSFVEAVKALLPMLHTHPVSADA